MGDLTKRQVPDLALPLPCLTAFHQQQDVLDGCAEREISADLKDTWHGKASPRALVGIARQGGDIVGQEHPTVARRPVEDRRIRGPVSPAS